MSRGLSPTTVVSRRVVANRLEFGEEKFASTGRQGNAGVHTISCVIEPRVAEHERMIRSMTARRPERAGTFDHFVQIDDKDIRHLPNWLQRRSTLLLQLHGVDKNRDRPMTTKFMKSIGIAALLAAFFSFGPLPALTSGIAEARTCKGKYLRSWGKRSSTMFGARVSARYAWKRASRAINGTKYDTWWPSRGKSMRCYTNRHGRRRCLAGAFPCTIF